MVCRRTPSPDILYKLAGIYNITVDDLMQLAIELDRNIYYDTPAPTQSIEDLAGFLEYFNNPNNKKKYQPFNNLEKKLILLEIFTGFSPLLRFPKFICKFLTLYWRLLLALSPQQHTFADIRHF
ncbi:MAG: hypothetical protein K2O99_09625 [Lachnospiraceae bacterium]|nr:hypothetical protein [Lachnospiraceae bacterium]